MALGDGLSVAEAVRRWLEEETSKVKAQTIGSYRAAFAKHAAHLFKHYDRPLLEWMALSEITRRIAGEFLAERHKASAGQTVGREFSAYNGLHRCACGEDT